MTLKSSKWFQKATKVENPLKNPEDGEKQLPEIKEEEDVDGSESQRSSNRGSSSKEGHMLEPMPEPVIESRI